MLAEPRAPAPARQEETSKMITCMTRRPAFISYALQWRSADCLCRFSVITTLPCVNTIAFSHHHITSSHITSHHIIAGPGTFHHAAALPSCVCTAVHLCCSPTLASVIINALSHHHLTHHSLQVLEHSIMQLHFLAMYAHQCISAV
jgi:hypothetical protein